MCNSCDEANVQHRMSYDKQVIPSSTTNITGNVDYVQGLSFYSCNLKRV
jgi:hypothetical protein